MSARRAILCVPASEAAKVEKAYASTADEVVVDLEDAVVADLKASARDAAAALPARSRGQVAVRVNGMSTPWFDDDVAAVAGNPHVATIVVPKIESAAELAALDDRLRTLASAGGRPHPLGVQALIESAAGLASVREIAAASARLVSLIIGYADLAASLGRDLLAPWSFAQDAVLVAARANGIQTIDGPLLSVQDDDRLASAADSARMLGFDGKWVIHPRQIETVSRAFTPTADQLEEAREIVAAMEEASRTGRGAVEWRGRMLDEAVAVRARRVLSQGENGR